MVAIVPIRMENNKKESTSPLIPISIETTQLPKPLVPNISQQHFVMLGSWSQAPAFSYMWYLEGGAERTKRLVPKF